MSIELQLPGRCGESSLDDFYKLLKLCDIDKQVILVELEKTHNFQEYFRN